MKTVIFCTTALLISAIALGQQTSVKSHQSVQGAASASNNANHLKASGTARAASGTALQADPGPAFRAGSHASASSQNEFNEQSSFVKKTASAGIESSREVTHPKPVGGAASVELNETPAALNVKASNRGDLSARIDNKTGAATSFKSEQSVRTGVSANKAKKAHVRTGAAGSANVSVRPQMKASGAIRSRTGLAL